MLVLITHECSGAVREAFAERGHTAVSVDLLPTVRPTTKSSEHHTCSIEQFAETALKKYGLFDLMISHPDCTYLTVSAAWAYGDGPYHQKVKPGTLVGAARREAREKAIAHVRWLMTVPLAKRRALENPVGAISSRIRKPDQTIHPHWFGDDASKATCLWLDKLPLLLPTKAVLPRMVNGKPRWGNQTDSGQNKLPPSENRWLIRATTYPGIASAFADQWGCLA